MQTAVATIDFSQIPSKLQNDAFHTAHFSFKNMTQTITEEGEWNGWLPLSLVIFNPTINPRKNINKQKKEQIKESLWRNGQRQNVEYRLSPYEEGKVEAVAGNTRTECMEELDGVECIWAKVSIMSDEEAATAAGVENIDRGNMTPIEEVEYAIKELNKNGYDTDELCRRFGWSKTKYNSFKALTYLGKDGRAALANDSITIGHAEVSSTLEEDTQEKVLNVILSEGLTIADTKERVKNLERHLDSACFDKTDCSSCQHNTSLTIDIFSTIQDGSRCRNGKCWNQKTVVHLEKVRIDKSEEYGKAMFDKDVANDTYTTLVQRGSNGVGKEQISSCASCDSFGCIINTRVGSEGKVKDGVCFDLSCHSGKVKDYQNLIATDAASRTVSEKQDNKNNDAGLQSASQKQAQSTTPSSSKHTSKKKGSAIKQPPKKMELYALQANANKASEIASADDNVVQVAATVSLLFDVGGVKRDEIIEACGVEIGKARNKLRERAHYYQLLYRATGDQLISIQTAATAHLMRKDAESISLRSAEYNKVALTTLAVKEESLMGQWKLDKAFLEAMPSKQAIVNLLEDVEFDKAYCAEHGKQALAKLLKEKSEPFKKAILAFSFDWSKHLPTLLRVETYLGK